jgi:hypothetical protein
MHERFHFGNVHGQLYRDWPGRQKALLRFMAEEHGIYSFRYIQQSKHEHYGYEQQLEVLSHASPSHLNFAEP